MNISLEIINKENKNKLDYLNVITYFIPNNEINAVHYLNCIQHNLNQKFVKNLVLFVNDSEFSMNFLNKKLNSLKNHEKINIQKINNDINYFNLFHYAQINHINENIAILRSDIILNDCDFLVFFPAFHNENIIYAISSTNKKNDKKWKHKNKMNNFYSVYQDLWLFKSPLNIDLEQFKKYNFNHAKNEGYINKILSEKYVLINDTDELLIYRECLEETEEKDLLRLEEKVEIDNKNMYLLPDNSILKKINVDQLLKFFKVDEKEIYTLKCKIFQNRT